MQKRLARFIVRELSKGIPAAMAIDKAFSQGIVKPDTARVRQQAEVLTMSLVGNLRLFGSDA